MKIRITLTFLLFSGIIGRKVRSDPGELEQTKSVSDMKLKNFAKLCKSCGFRVRKRSLDVWTSCQCRFLWCCKVECETCKKQLIEMTCVP